MTTAIVPASGTSSTRAPTPTTTALKAATIVTPRKYRRIDWMTLLVIVVATGRGTPRCPSRKRRTAGPSLSRKKVLKSVKVRKKTSEVRPLIPSATPWTSVFPVVAVSCLRSCVAFAVPFAPVSLTQPWIVSTAFDADALISSDCSTIPPKTSRTITTNSASSPRRTIAAPAARGNRGCIIVTSGPATVARIRPTSTGSVIVEVSPISQMSPTSSNATPTRNQAASPRSRSHIGAEKTRESDVASISTTVRGGASGATAFG